MFTYPSDFAKQCAIDIGEWHDSRGPAPMWLVDRSVSYDQWVASTPMQGVTSPVPIPHDELPIVWRAWQYRRAEIEARWLMECEGVCLAPALERAREGIE